MQALILCGGLSTRLGDITKEIPKVLLDVGGKTVLEYQVEMLVEAGAKEIFLASGHLHERLEAEVGNELNGIPIHYVQEHKRLGTGGAIKNGLNHMSEYPIFVLNGDILLDHPLTPMLEMLTPEMDGVLLGVEVEDARSYGRLLFDEESRHIQQFVEKDPSHEGSGVINGGVYLFNKTIHNFFPAQDSFSVEYDVFPNVEKLYVHTYRGEWIDIGTPDRLQFAREHLADAFSQARSEG